MKIYQSCLAALAIAAAATLFSCSDSQELVANANELQAKSQDQPTIVFKIKTPSGSSVKYNNGRRVNAAGQTQTDAEAAIKTLQMFEIDAATDKLFSDPVDLQSQLGSGTVNAEGDIVYQITASNPNMSSKGRRYVFVANNTVDNSGTAYVTGDSWSSIEAHIAKQAIAANDAATKYWLTETGWDAAALPMTGEAIFEGNNIIRFDKVSTNYYEVTVELNRIVARIDVVNNLPNFVINSVQMLNANDHSYVLPHKDGSGNTELPTGTTRVKPITPFWSYDDQENAKNSTTGVSYEFKPTLLTSGPNTGDVDVKATLEQAFYAYEDLLIDTNPEQNCLRLRVQGILNGEVTVSYDIPFMKKYQIDGSGNPLYTSSDAAYTENIPITRNTLYRVEIGDGKPISFDAEIKFKLIVDDWNYVKVDDELINNVFVFFDGGAVEAGDGKYVRSTRTLTLSDDAVLTTDELSIQLDEKFDYKNSDAVVKYHIDNVEIIGIGNTDNWFTTTLNSDGNAFSIVATQNTTGAVRSTSVRVTYYTDANFASKTDPHVDVFHIRQEAAAGI